MPRSKITVPAVLLALAILFLIANRAAYGSYFQDDDLDTLGWTWTVPLRQYLIAFLTPVHSPGGMRPTGHLFYRAMDAVAGLDIVPWIAAIQALHLLNGLLVWMVLRQFGASLGPAVAGLVIFLFHPATFDASWRPMFVFDVLCATFTLLALLLYVRGRWWLSLPAFWLAYKAKELAVMLPVVLLIYELTAGERRLRRLIPFALISASFTLQAILGNRGTSTHYTLQFTWAALGRTLRFYFYQMFRNFLTGALMIGIPAVLRDRKIAFAVSSAFLLFGPLLLLPNRMLSVYTYLPLAFIALALALIAERWRWTRVAAPAVILLLWAPVTWSRLRDYQVRELETAAMNRIWVSSVGDFIRSSPQTRNFVIDGRPMEMHAWGAVGAIRYFTRSGDFRLESIDSAEGRKLMAENDVALFIWDGSNRTVHVGHYRK